MRDTDKWIMFSFVARSCKKDMLMESWAEGVETIVTNDRYLKLNPNYNSSNSSGRRWNASRQEMSFQEMTEYTPIVDDLIDDLNQNIDNNNWPIDRVRGYNLNQIQGALRNCRDINCWESNLRNQNTNSTEGNLAELFNYMRAVLHNNNPERCN